MIDAVASDAGTRPDASTSDSATSGVSAPDASGGTPDAAGNTTDTSDSPWATFTATAADPLGDDTGDGDYAYPSRSSTQGSTPMSIEHAADLESFTLTHDADRHSVGITIGLARITTETRVGVVLLDETAIARGVYGWTIGGTELRVPSFDQSGVQISLADPEGELFDFGVRHDLHPLTETLRPDNVIYVQEADGGRWISRSGGSSNIVDEALRLDVFVDRSMAADRFHVTIPDAVLASHLDLMSPNLYVVVFSYLLIDPGPSNLSAVEFGALEITEALGGLPNDADNPWRDADVYDIAFTPGGEQPALLTAPTPALGPSDDQRAVVLRTVGSGLIRISTSPIVGRKQGP